MKSHLASRLCTWILLIAVIISPVHAKARDSLVIGMTQFPAAFHPNMELMVAKYYVLNMTMRPFTAYDKNWEVICFLCVSVPSIENASAVVTQLDDGRQGIAVTFAIDSDARWGDGTPVTTRDVEYTIEVGKNPVSGVVDAEFYRRILSIDAHDEKNFTIYWDRIDFKYNEFALYLMPEHIDRKYFSEPDKYRERNAYNTEVTNPGLYSGPYRISHIEHGSHIELVRNDQWWGSEPYFDKIVVRIIENTAALEANLLSGSIDYISGELGLLLDQALTFRKRRGDSFDYIFQPGLVYEHIELNLDNPILADVRVRQALLYGIDRQAVSDFLFDGKQPVADVFVSPLDVAHHAQVKKYQYDKDRASKLLDEAGWTNWIDGVRHNANDQPLRLDFGTTAGSRGRETVQQVLQGQWKEIGIDTRIRNEPARVFFGDTVTYRKFGAMAMFAWSSNPESSPRYALHSEEIPSDENQWVGSNYSGFQNSEMDELIDTLEVTLDSEKRMQIWARIQDIYAQQLPVLPLYFRSRLYIIPKWLKGIEPTGNTSTTTLWVENWSVE